MADREKIILLLILLFIGLLLAFAFWFSHAAPM
jgi:hypothetical protein